MASAQQLIGLVKSHAEGDGERFFDLAIQLSEAEARKGHSRLAEQLRLWAETGATPKAKERLKPTPLVQPRGDLGEFLAASYPRRRLGDLILPSAIADELAHLRSEARHSVKLEKYGLLPRRRILLSGPPGTGKTMTASALAGELGLPLFTVLLHGLITKYMGETAQKLRLVFDAIASVRGVYLFDEIDALAAQRGGENDAGEARRILNSFLQFLDEDVGCSIIIATTNLPEILDGAILRRFDAVLPYELPDTAVIETAMRLRLTSFDVDDVDWKKIKEMALGLSTADVISVAEDAARRVVIADRMEITTSLLVASLERRKALFVMRDKKK